METVVNGNYVIVNIYGLISLPAVVEMSFAVFMLHLMQTRVLFA